MGKVLYIRKSKSGRVRSLSCKAQHGRLSEFRSGQTSGERTSAYHSAAGKWIYGHPTLPPCHRMYTRLSCLAADKLPLTATSTSGKDRIVAIHLAQKAFPVEKRGIVVQQRAVDRHARFLCERLQQERVELDGRGDTVGVDVDERFRRDSRRLNGDGGDAARCGIR